MDSIFVYYDSKTGNVERFIEKVRRKRPEWKFIKITNIMEVKNEGHFITYTTNFGEISNITTGFLETGKNREYIKSVSSSGNMNWGSLYGAAANKITEKYGIPTLMKFELSGRDIEVDYFIDYVEEKSNGW